METPKTVGELLEFYIEHHLVLFVKSHRGTAARLRRYVGEFATVPLADLTRVMVIGWHHSIGQTRGTGAANLALQSLRSMYAKASEWEIYAGSNPADRLRKFPRHTRTRFVQPQEMPWLLGALSEETELAQTYFLMLLLTGARRDEARTAKWPDLDLEQGLWHKPTTKTGVPHTIPLPHALVERLRHLPRITEYVFSSRSNVMNRFTPGCWSRSAINWTWRRIRKRAGLPDLRIHDLRRTCASWLAINGANIPVIQTVLNHSSLAVTQTYTRLTVQPVRDALESQAQRMLGKTNVPAPSPTENSEGRPRGSESPRTWMGSAGNA